MVLVLLPWRTLTLSMNTMLAFRAEIAFCATNYDFPHCSMLQVLFFFRLNIY